jgi:hypothetical protein
MEGKEYGLSNADLLSAFAKQKHKYIRPLPNLSCMLRKILVPALSCLLFQGLSAQQIALPRSQTFSQLRLQVLGRPTLLQMADLNLSPIAKPTYNRLDSLVFFAMRFLGAPYRFAGASPRGFDCSGFTAFVFSHFGLSLPRAAGGQAVGKPVNPKEAHKGDLIFFKGSNWRSPYIGHVGMVISERGHPLRFIHSSINMGISVVELRQSDYYKTRFLKICRIVPH